MYALSGLYKPGLSYEQAKVLAAKLPSSQRSAMLSAAVAALPSCYSQAFRDCIHDVGTPTPQCAAILEGYVASWDQMEKLVADMRYCQEPVSRTLLIGVGVLTLLVGVGVGMALK